MLSLKMTYLLLDSYKDNKVCQSILSVLSKAQIIYYV